MAAEDSGSGSLRVCYLPDGFNANTFYRLVFPFMALGWWKPDGSGTAVTPFYEYRERSDGTGAYLFDLDVLPEADVYVLQEPLDIGVAELAKRLRRTKVVIGESDDSPFPASWHPTFYGTHHGVRPDRSRYQRHRAFQCCDAMTVSTPALGEQWRKANPQQHVLPNFLLWEMWKNVTPQYEVERERVRVGWMGDSTWRQGDLDVLRPVLREFLVAHPTVDFVAAGDKRVHDLLGVPEGQRVTVPGVKFPKGLPELTASMDVGLVPLNLDAESRPFNDAKSNLKGMEYAACGIPCVASPSRPYLEWTEPGVGFLATEPEDWFRHLSFLVSDQEARRAMGRAAREKAFQHRIERHAHLWSDLYLTLVERKRKRLREGLYAHGVA